MGWVGTGWVGSQKMDPWTTLLAPYQHLRVLFLDVRGGVFSCVSAVFGQSSNCRFRVNANPYLVMKSTCILPKARVFVGMCCECKYSAIVAEFTVTVLLNGPDPLPKIAPLLLGGGVMANAPHLIHGFKRHLNVCLVHLECWMSTKDVHGSDGIDYKLSTLGQCESVCVSISTCVAIDWEPSNPDGKTCWILTTTSTVPTTKPDVVTHYELNRDCLLSS